MELWTTQAGDNKQKQEKPQPQAMIWELQLSTYFTWGFLGVEDPAWCKSQHKPTAALAQGKSASGGLEMGFSALAIQIVWN